MEDLYYGNEMEMTYRLIANTSDTSLPQKKNWSKILDLKRAPSCFFLATFKTTFKLTKT